MAIPSSPRQMAGRPSQKLTERKPTLIVSDVMMPEMDGYMLCREIKRTEELKDIPVVLLTSLSDIRDIMKGLECGADNFIRKPYDRSVSPLPHQLSAHES